MAVEPVTVVVVEDHPVCCAGIRMWCAEADRDLRVVVGDATLAEAWTGPGADANVVVFDLHLRDDQPAFQELRGLVDAGRTVVVYSSATDDSTVRQCVRHVGAHSYVTKREGPDHLIGAICAAADRRPYTPPTLSGAIVADPAEDRPALSLREEDALRAWASSASMELAGRRLNVSRKSLETYIARARAKYASVGRPAPSKTALVLRALEDGILKYDELTDDAPGTPGGKEHPAVD